MKALGAVNPAEVDIFDVEKNIDGILLSSDGLTNMLSVEQIENVLKMDISLEDKAKKLIVKSNNLHAIAPLKKLYCLRERIPIFFPGSGLPVNIATSHSRKRSRKTLPNS